MTQSRKYAIIGCGMMGREHMQNLAIVDGADLVAIADPDAGSRAAASELAEQLGQKVELFDDSSTMLAAIKPDAVIIASPNFTHFDAVKPVMETGAAILLEKPMCTTIADAEALAKAAQEYENLFWVGLEYRYMPPVTRFIKRIHAGEAGDIKMLAIREHRFPFLVKVGDWNRFNRNSGGTLVEKCCHFFDLMRHIMRDEPVRVFASGAQNVNHLDESYDGETPDILDNAFVIVDFAGGARAVLDLCMFAEGSEQQEEISAVGRIGKMEVKLPIGEVTWSPRDKSGPFVSHIETPSDALAAGDHHGATFFQQRDFHDALINGTKPLIDAQDGYRSVVIGAAAQQSIETGLPVDITYTDED
ncbi:Gfo/Idh/MocA family oxidoreductase [Erythrobacter sp. F6033]|uniref:Gfo/Idh/MocA family protein n=1 Tax=Erythrobacter sp. F6033 TaxID=2926401 RepID=UPI001FF3E030|nr:Gfo/Idh/MocA family oxidoreductase [Erythrobacter sp. F6033]MCK0127382.1 Gfo/Idh/MocA family oxidoreductase [Erythrobacter sp. F6033]